MDFDSHGYNEHKKRHGGSCNSLLGADELVGYLQDSSNTLSLGHGTGSGASMMDLWLLSA